MNTESSVRGYISQSLTFAANRRKRQDLFTSYTNHEGGYPRWPPILIVILFLFFWKFCAI